MSSFGTKRPSCVWVRRQPGQVFPEAPISLHPPQVENKEVTRRILHDPAPYNEKFSPECKSCCEGLLAKDPAKRLGFKNNSCSELKNHLLFQKMNWSRLEAGEDLLGPCVGRARRVPSFPSARSLSCQAKAGLRATPLAPLPTRGRLESSSQLVFARERMQKMNFARGHLRLLPPKSGVNGCTEYFTA